MPSGLGRPNGTGIGPIERSLSLAASRSRPSKPPAAATDFAKSSALPVGTSNTCAPLSRPPAAACAAALTPKSPTFAVAPANSSALSSDESTSVNFVVPSLKSSRIRIELLPTSTNPTNSLALDLSSEEVSRHGSRSLSAHLAVAAPDPADDLLDPIGDGRAGPASEQRGDDRRRR